MSKGKKPNEEDTSDEIKAFCRHIGGLVAEKRKVLGLSQEELAHRAGFYRTHISIIERGEKATTIWTLKKIADELGVKPSELFGEAGF